MKYLRARAGLAAPSRPRNRPNNRGCRAPFRLVRNGQPGQTLVLFALASLVLMGALGLVLDTGYDLAQRRAMQNAADAAALAGTRDVQRNSMWVQGISGATQITTTQLYNDVLTVAQLNGLQDTTKLRCELVANGSNGESSADDGNGNCNKNNVSQSIPTTATGVRVTVSESHQTFVMRVVGIGTSGTGATATAHVEAVPPGAFDLGGGPFIVCGVDTVVTDSNGNPTGTTMSILNTTTKMINGVPEQVAVFDSSGHAEINQQAVSIPNSSGSGFVGPWFLIHGPNNNPIAKCDTGPGADFMGFNDQTDNAGKTVTGPPGTIIQYGNGNKAGQVKQAVPALGGCKPGGGWENSPCLMILPLTDEGDPGNKPYINCVGWGLFYVVELGPNRHIAQLVSGVTLQTSGTLTFNPTGPYTYTATRLTR